MSEVTSNPLTGVPPAEPPSIQRVTTLIRPRLWPAVLILAGLNMLAVGLLGEMQVRHYHEPTRRAPYSVDRILRAQSEEHTVSE